MRSVGVVSPGAMGAAVADAARASDRRFLWAGAGRSARTRARAEAAGMEDAGTLDDLVGMSGTILSICPPERAVEVAHEVFGLGFRGVFVDANAIAPSTARTLAEHAPDSVSFVDGGIVGPPPLRGGTTRLYLSGGTAADVAGLFTHSRLEAIVLDAPPGAASALKVCYAANTKAGGALLMAIRALAVAEGVDTALVAEWERSQPHALAVSESWARGSAPKAWRFVGEMHEIGDALTDAGIPDGFLRAAAEVYGRIADFKDSERTIELSEVVAALLDGDDQ
jgi:hypothetical protein